MDIFKDKKLRKHLFDSFWYIFFCVGGSLIGVFLIHGSFNEPYVTESTGLTILAFLMGLGFIGFGIFLSYIILKELTVMQSLVIIFIVVLIFTYMFFSIKYDWKWV